MRTEIRIGIDSSKEALKAMKEKMSYFKSELFVEKVIIKHIKIQNMGKIEGKIYKGKKYSRSNDFFFTGGQNYQ